ncbi:hypothetical protein [Spiroplasma floricola]|uniref:Uncharacterized protein n=1 Tax=Spiroplasma floricola 23-6 TaxID=1336749 RepID=A0A2K8SDN3_9MOLU|nr:hypothetical protein [Spiroplasma floricola]AUB31533.1 hypothetical protein SFLOR_v1c04810 [Spiroplasma floricola 23-6]
MNKKNLTKFLFIIYAIFASFFIMSVLGLFLVPLFNKNYDLITVFSSIYLESIIGFVIFYFSIGFIFCSIASFFMMKSYEKDKFTKKVIWFSIPGFLAMIWAIPMGFILYKYITYFKKQKKIITRKRFNWRR